MQQGWHPYTSIHVRGGGTAEPRNVPVISSQLSGDERPRRDLSGSSSTGVAEAQFEAVDMGAIYQQRGGTHGCGIALAAFLAAGERAPRIRFQPARGSEAYQAFKEIHEMCLQRDGLLVSSSEGLCIVAMTLLHGPGKNARELWGYVLPPDWLRDVARRMRNRQYCLVLDVDETLGTFHEAAAGTYSPQPHPPRAGDGAVRVGLAYKVPVAGGPTTRHNIPDDGSRRHDFWIRPGVEGLDPEKFELYVNSHGCRPYVMAALQTMRLGYIPEDRIVARDPDDPAFAGHKSPPSKTLEVLHLTGGEQRVIISGSKANVDQPPADACMPR